MSEIDTQQPTGELKDWQDFISEMVRGVLAELVKIERRIEALEEPKE